jgi:hypothetical protein
MAIGGSTHCKSNTKNFIYSFNVQDIVYRGRSSFKDEQLQYVLVIFLFSATIELCQNKGTCPARRGGSKQVSINYFNFVYIIIVIIVFFS